jgi:hypothetical protein
VAASFSETLGRLCLPAASVAARTATVRHRLRYEFVPGDPTRVRPSNPRAVGHDGQPWSRDQEQGAPEISHGRTAATIIRRRVQVLSLAHPNSDTTGSASAPHYGCRVHSSRPSTGRRGPESSPRRSTHLSAQG